MTDAEATTADATRVHGDRAERLRGAPSPALMLTGRRDHFGGGNCPVLGALSAGSRARSLATTDTAPRGRHRRVRRLRAHPRRRRSSRSGLSWASRRRAAFRHAGRTTSHVGLLVPAAVPDMRAGVPNSAEEGKVDVGRRLVPGNVPQQNNIRLRPTQPAAQPRADGSRHRSGVIELDLRLLAGGRPVAQPRDGGIHAGQQGLLGRRFPSAPASREMWPRPQNMRDSSTVSPRRRANGCVRTLASVA